VSLFLCKMSEISKEEELYYAMLNTFNVLTNKLTYDDIFESETGQFLLVEPHINITFNHINDMIGYFESKEMYENCAALLHIRKEDYNDDGTTRENIPKCKCKIPEVLVYSIYSRCQNCGLRII